MPATKNELEDFDKRFQEKYGRGPLDIQTQESKALNIKSTTPVQPSTSATATKTELDNFDKKFREKYGRNPLNIQTTESRRIQTPYTTHLDAVQRSETNMEAAPTDAVSSKIQPITPYQKNARDETLSVFQNLNSSERDKMLAAPVEVQRQNNLQFENTLPGYAGYTALQFGSGALSTLKSLEGGARQLSQDFVSGGQVSDDFQKIERFLQENPAEKYFVDQQGDVMDENVSEHLANRIGVNPKSMRTYLVAREPERVSQSIEDAAQNLNETYRNTVGQGAYMLGQMAPGLLASAVLPASASGGIIGRAVQGARSGKIGGAVAAAVKDAAKGNVATWMLGGSSLSQALQNNARQYGAKAGTYADAIANGFIESFSEGLFGFSDIPSVARFLGTATGRSVTTFMRQLGRYLLTGSEEGLEEMVAGPLQSLSTKLFLDHDRKWFGEGGVFDAKQMLEDGVAGAAMGMVLGSAGAVISTYSALQESHDVRSAVNALNASASVLDEDIRPAPRDPNQETFESANNYAEEVTRGLIQQEQRLRQQARQASQEANGQEQQTEQPNVVNTNSTSGLVWAGSERNTASSAQHIEQLAGQLPAHAAERFRRLAQGMPETSLDGLYQSFLDAYYSAGTEAGGLSLSDPVQQEARRAWQEDREEADQAERIVQGLGEQGRAAYLSGYTPGVNAVPYNTGFSRAYEQGLAGGTADGRNTQAYTAGRQDAAASLAREQARVSDAVRYGAQSGLVESEYNAGLRRQERRVLDQFAKDLGVQVQIEAPAGGRANGWYQDGVVHIAADTENPILVVGAHEITHRMQELAPEEYRRYRDYAAGAALAEMEDLVNQYRDRYTKAGVELSAEEAMDEIAADYTRRMIEQPELFEQMARDDRSLARRILDALLDFLDRIRARFSSQQSRNEASQAAYGVDLKTLEEAARLWQRAYDAASQAAGQTESASRTEGAARYSINQTFNSEIQEWYNEGRSDGERFTLGSTGPVLQGLGAIESDIYMNSDKINTILETHPEMTIREIQRIPEVLEDPVLVLKSRNVGRGRQQNSRLVLFGSIKAQDGRPVMCVLDLRPTENGFLLDDMQKVSSAYTKDVKPIEFVSNSEVLHADEKRTIPLLRTIGFKMPITLQRSGSIGSITYKGPKVNLAGVPFSSVVDTNEQNQSKGKTEMELAFEKAMAEQHKTRFSLKEPVEGTRDLIALHNLTEQKLLGSLRLGGMPMPSIAIVQAQQGHSKYGPISLVFGKDSIDPQADSRNRVYGGDAWTPTAPRVDYPINYQVQRAFEDRVEQLAANVAGGAFNRSSVLGTTGITGDSTSMDIDEIVRRMAGDNAVQAAYLAEQGRNVEPVMKAKQFDSFGNESLDAYIDRVGEQEVARLAANLMTGERLTEADIETAKDAIMERWTAQNEWRLNKKPELRETRIAKQREKISDARTEAFIRNAWDFFQDGGATTGEVDYYATRDALEAAVDKQAVADWARQQLDGLLGEPGIHNGRDPFTPAGNPRSFEQLHYPYTLENLVKAMSTTQEARGGGLWGVTAKGLQAVSTPAYQSVDEIHADESRLRNLTQEEYDDLLQDVDDGVGQAIEAVRSANKAHSDNRWEEADIIGSVLIDAARGRHTPAAVVNTFRKEGYAISRETAQKIIDLYDQAAELPTEYFEAKPQRAVGFDEVLAAVVPDDSSRALLDGLEQAGVQTLEYRSGDDADRLEKVNSVEEARFSLRGGDILHESAELRREEQQLQQRFASLQREKGRQRAGNSTIQRVARELRQIIGSGTELNELTERVRAIYDGIVSGALDYSQARGQALELGQELVENAVMADDTLYREYADLRKFLRDTRIQVSETDSHDIPDYNTFRRHNFGRLRLAKGRTNIDQIYQELSESWPGLFDERRHSVPMDQLVHISEVLDDIYARPSYNPYSQDLQQAAEGAANEILGRILDLSGAEAMARPDSAQMIRRAIERERTTREELIELSGRYGRMEPGERPFRDITVPLKTSENMRVSRTVRTALEAEATPDELVPDIEKLVAEGEFSYEAYGDEQAKKDAEQRIQEIKFDAAKTEWERAIHKGRSSKFNTALGWTLYNEAANSGKTETAIQILTEMVGYQRDNAQALQAARILKQLSPDAQLYSATKAASDIQRDLDERHSRGSQYKLKEESETAKKVGEAVQSARSDAAKALRNGDETFEQSIEKELNRLFRRRKDKDAQTEAAKKDIAWKVSEIVSDRNARKSARDAVISMLIEKYGVSEADAAAAAQVVGERFDTLVQESMQKRLDSIFKERQKPKRRTIQQRFEELANLGAFASEQYNEMAARRIVGDVPGIRIDPAMAEEFLNARTQDERDAIMKRIYMDIGRQMPSNFLDKWNAWRYFAMLANPRTHIRNIFGNTFFVPVVAAKNLTATAIESAVHFVSGGRTERGKAFVGASKSDRALLSAAWNDFSKVEDVISGVGKYEDSVSVQRSIQEGRRIFQSNKRLLNLIARPMEAARRGAGNLLTLEDMWFSKPHYAYALAQYCKAHGITEADIKAGNGLDAARAYAIKEAQKATYRDANMLSQAISGLGRYHGENPVLRAGSMLMDGILPFRSTPANILVRGLEYSPAGLLNGIKQALWDVRRGNMTATQAIDSISAGLTGSGLVLLGLWMAAQGWVRGHGSDDEDEEAFLEMLGHQQYAVEVFGDSYTLDWLAPEALPFFMGVNAYEAAQRDGEFNMADLIGVLTRIGEPMMQMSFLQSFNDAFDAVKYAANRNMEESVAALADAATSYLMQGFPSFLGQIERASQADRMTTYTNPNAFLTTDMQYTLGSISARVPGVDYQQIPYIDAWGRKETEDSTAIRVRDNMFNPSYTDNYGETDLETELLRLYDAVGSSAVFPERADKSFKVNGEDLYLDADQYVKYATEKGKGSLELATKIYESAEYKLLDDETKVEVISDAYAYANAIAKTKVSEYEPDGWVANALESGMKPEDYIIANARLDNMSSFNAMIESGIDSETAFTVAQAISSLEPEKGEETVSSMQKYKAVLHENLEEAEKVEALEYLMPNGTAEKFSTAVSYGITSEQYVDYMEHADANGNGSVTQKEAQDMISSISGLSQQQRAVLWQLQNKSWKSENNPFGYSGIQQEPESGGLTLGGGESTTERTTQSTSFGQLILGGNRR